MRRPIIVAGVLLAVAAIVGAVELRNHYRRPATAPVVADRTRLEQQLSVLAATQQRCQQRITDLEAQLAARTQPAVAGDQAANDEIARLQAMVAELRTQLASATARGTVPDVTASVPAGAAPGSPSPAPVAGVADQGPAVSSAGEPLGRENPAPTAVVTEYGPDDIGTATLTEPSPAPSEHGGQIWIVPYGVAAAPGVTPAPRVAAAPGVFPRIPAPGISSGAPAPGVSSHAPAPGVSSHAPAPGVSSHAPAPGVSSRPPAPGLSSRH